MMKNEAFFSIVTDDLIYSVCKYVIEQKMKGLDIEELLHSIVVRTEKRVANISYRKIYASYLWNRINDYMSSNRAGNCLLKSMAMYRLSSILGWEATIFICLPKDFSSTTDRGHSYIRVKNHFWGMDPSIEYQVVFFFEKDEIQWKR